MLTVVAAVVMLGLLIFVHELGHFLAFKAIGVKVLKFSLGFDPVLYKRQVGETSYQIGWIPIGGYVRPLGEQDDDEVAPEDRGRAVGDKPLWARSIAFAAGPLMNLAFPLLIYAVVYTLPGEELSSRIGMIVQGMPAEAAGIQPGDRIAAVDGVPTPYWADLQEAISERPGKTFPITIDRRGQAIALHINAEAVVETNRLGEKRTEGRVGISPFSMEARVVVTEPAGPAAAAGVRSWDLVTELNGAKVLDWIDFKDRFERAGAATVELKLLRREEKTDAAKGRGGRKDRSSAKTQEVPAKFASPGTLAGAGLDLSNTYIRDIEPGGPAATAGIVSGDRIVSIDGRKVGYWGTLEDAFRRDPEREFELVWARGTETHSGRVKLVKKTEKDEFKQEIVTWTLGAYNDAGYTGGEYVRHPFQPARGVSEAFKTTGEIIRVTYIAVFKLVTGDLSLKTVGGPIMIFDMAGTVAKKGAMSYFWFMGLISINLGIFNLLPIPILDGGHLMLAAVEAAARRPLSRRVRMATTYVGIAFLASMFILVMKNDIARYWDSIVGYFR